VRAGVLIQKMYKTEKINDYCKKLKDMTSVIYIMMMEAVYFSNCNLAKPSLFEEIGLKFKQWVTVSLACYTDGSDKLTPLVIRKYKSPHRFNNVKKLSTK
jgi:hypothetical protein